MVTRSTKIFKRCARRAISEKATCCDIGGAVRRRTGVSTRAHTVPKFYLNGFVAPGSEREQNPSVWVGSLTSGEITRRSPKNISISRGLYDGRGGFDEQDTTLEAHLAKIESAASSAIRKFTASKIETGVPIPSEITRFLAWQAARTPGWMEIVERWADQTSWDSKAEVVEPPPDGFDKIRDRTRPMCLEDPNTGDRREVTSEDEFHALRGQGWKWILRRDDDLEMLHLQAWYFQVRHFPRLSWVRLQPPDGEYFITSDRSVAWLADGYADTPPAALRHPTAQIFAPLTRESAPVGRHGAAALGVTPREMNRFVAFAASDWIAGPTAEVVRQALIDRRDSRH
jgi:Protein of unknown function (DUF4238)